MLQAAKQRRAPLARSNAPAQAPRGGHARDIAHFRGRHGGFPAPRRLESDTENYVKM